MLNENFVILGVAINFLGGLSYLFLTIKGKVKPNRVTWFLWALAPLIAFSAEIGKGVGIQSLMTFIVGFNPLLIFFGSFVNKKAEWKLGTLDYVIGGLSLLGIFLWYLTKDGNYAISFAIVADGLAAVPTLIKSYSFPETENYLAYLTAFIAAGITLLTIDIWSFAHYGFPVYILLTTFVFVLLIKFRLGKLIQARIAKIPQRS